MSSNIGPWFGPPRDFIESWDSSNDEYHSSPGVSKSMLDVFIQDPLVFEGRFVSKWLERKRPSDAMKLGTLLHDIVLDPLGVGASVQIVPRDALTLDGRKSGMKFKHWRENNPGGIPIRWNDPVAFMLEAVRRNEMAMALLSAATDFEENQRWTDRETGLLLRSRTDGICWPTAILDLKSTRDASPAEFTKSVLKYGYHRQAAMYQEPWEILSGERLPFYFIAVQSSEPYHCRVYQLSDEFVELGRQQIADARRRLAECLLTGVWADEVAGKIVELDPPAWATKPAGAITFDGGSYEPGTDEDDGSGGDYDGAGETGEQ